MNEEPNRLGDGQRRRFGVPARGCRKFGSGPMAIQQIPCGNVGLRRGAGGIVDRAGRGLFPDDALKSRAERRDLGRNGPVCIVFSRFAPERLRSRRMTEADPRHIPVHIPVLGSEAVAMLSPQTGGVYVDATFGAGGYSRAILDVAGTRVTGIDRDPTAIAGGFGACGSLAICGSGGGPGALTTGGVNGFGGSTIYCLPSASCPSPASAAIRATPAHRARPA